LDIAGSKGGKFSFLNCFPGLEDR